MKHSLILSFLLIGHLVLLAGEMPETVIEGRDDVLWLDAWAAPGRWDPAECTVKAADERLADGRPTIHLHIPVDHLAGEKNYPIGWPRIGLNPKQDWEKDWTAFDRFEFAVYTQMAPPRLPRTPVALILYCPDRNRSWNRSLDELKLGEWVRFSLPIDAMRYADNVARVAFAISESNYRHGDALDFYIGGFRFVRARECRLASLNVRNAVLFDDRPALDVEVEAEGVPRDATRPVPFTIRRGDVAVRTESLAVRRGRSTLTVDLSPLKLGPGTCTITAFDGDADRATSATFRIVSSPWKEP